MEIELNKSPVSGMNEESQPVDEDANPALISRRIFLRYVVGAVGSFVGIVAGAPIIGYLGGVFQAKGLSAQWIKLGRVEQFSDAAPQAVQFTLTRQDGWVETREARSCWVVHDGDKLAVLNGRCTHLGCAYHWEREGENENRFFCPCHGGVYDIGGHVIDGPPPRQLDRLETKVENGDLLALYQDFRLGIPEKVEL